MAKFLESLAGLSGGPRRFAAIDSDGRRIWVVYAERVGRRTRVLKLAAVAIPPTLNPADPQQFGVLLGQTLKDMRLRNVGVLMNVTRAEAVLKPVTLPPGASNEELAGMVQFQVEKELPFRPEEAVIDFTIESHYDAETATAEAGESKGTDVLVGAVRLPVVDRYRRIAEAAGVRLLRLGLRPYANVRCVNACTRTGPEETVLLLHFGSDETEIDLLVGNSLMFSRSASVKIPPADADPHELAESVRAVAMEVRRSVQSYLAVERAFQIDAILVAGGTGVEAVAAEELSERLGAPCELFNPAMALGLGDVESPSAFISALGLAIGHSGADQLPFDFLNPKRPVKRRNKARTMAIAGASVLAAILLVGGTAAGLQLSERSAAVEKVRADVYKARAKQKALLSIEKKVKSLKEWQDDRRDWLAHWAYLSSLFPGAPDAYISGFKTAADGSISFMVKSRDSKIITDLATQLEDAGYKFQPGRLATTPDPYGYPYSSDVRVFIDPEMAIDLHSVKPVARPEDDDSIRQLARVGSSSSEASAPVAPSPEATPAVTPAGAPPAAPVPGAIVLPPDVKQVVRQDLLAKYDRDHNGKLDKREGRYANYYVSKKYLQYFDTNRNGKIDREEFTGIRAFLAEME